MWNESDIGISIVTAIICNAYYFTIGDLYNKFVELHRQLHPKFLDVNP